jgi:NADH dehydrogenase [ubiquinone] 1 alpha subcomplex assembly factor 7
MSIAATMPLEAELRHRLERAGALSVAEYMELCLTHPEHGYYTTRAPIGARGDFTTAPEISQMFGELLGIWAVAVWRAMGSPENIRLVELGPGRGTMMIDVLRAANVVPEFRPALVLHLVEISPALERVQRQALAGHALPVSWHRSLDEVPDGPLILLANEFVDALPVHQAVMCADGWHERVVKLGNDGAFHFSIDRNPIPLFNDLPPSRLRNAKIGDIFEWRHDRMALEIGRRVAKWGGAALLIDYGHVETAIGDTLQAISRHGFVDPLVAPGLVDLTAHVDFQALAQAGEGMGARAHGPLEQAEFLRRLGIKHRAATLKTGAAPDMARAVDAALDRLMDRTSTGMGRMIKCIAFSGEKLQSLPAFD